MRQHHIYLIISFFGLELGPSFCTYLSRTYPLNSNVLTSSCKVTVNSLFL